MPDWRACCAAAVLAAAAGATSAQAPEQAAAPAAQRPRQDFVAPAAGTYALPPIQPAAEGWVLDSDGRTRRLSTYTHGALTLLSFVYTYCTDPVGCPLAYAAFATVKDRVLADPLLRGRVRLVSLSFDPTHDTPPAMRAYGGEHARDKALPWFFLTTASTAALKSILDDFGQDVDIELDPDGTPTRAFTHLLKVFLLDARGDVREIYSAAFLHTDVIVNDLRTLAMEPR